uniref:Homing endonuclease LAGLIDADG domain-containing protein n=1 Tax=Ophiocordyceps sinensis TaxID=72228 RepID=A0A513X004_9HYPO|nr:hypothetical protein [Ophiocordyceps sinensis]
MNFGRTLFKYDITRPQIIINPQWFIGFIEGEGTFGIKTGSSLYFQVAPLRPRPRTRSLGLVLGRKEKITSQESLNAIVAFLTELSNADIPKNSKISSINVTNATNIKTNVISLVISNIDALFYYILPLLDSSKMYTRKYIDFKLWKTAILLKIKGYYYLSEGKNLFLDISEVLNKRYSTNKNKSVEDINKAI